MSAPEELLPFEAHRKWLHAFSWWYHNGKRDRIIANLREGVPLSPENSKFLAAVFDGTAKPLTGKQTGLARFKSNIIDNAIHDLRNRSYTREKIRKELQRSGKAVMLIDGVNKRIDRTSTDYVEGHAELIKKFAALYETITEK